MVSVVENTLNVRGTRCYARKQKETREISGQFNKTGETHRVSNNRKSEPSVVVNACSPGLGRVKKTGLRSSQQTWQDPILKKKKKSRLQVIPSQSFLKLIHIWYLKKNETLQLMKKPSWTVTFNVLFKKFLLKRKKNLVLCDQAWAHSSSLPFESHFLRHTHIPSSWGDSADYKLLRLVIF